MRVNLNLHIPHKEENQKQIIEDISFIIDTGSSITTVAIEEFAPYFDYAFKCQQEATFQTSSGETISTFLYAVLLEHAGEEIWTLVGLSARYILYKLLS
jgi:hypothetical protein